MCSVVYIRAKGCPGKWQQIHTLLGLYPIHGQDFIAVAQAQDSVDKINKKAAFTESNSIYPVSTHHKYQKQCKYQALALEIRTMTIVQDHQYSNSLVCHGVQCRQDRKGGTVGKARTNYRGFSHGPLSAAFRGHPSRV
jgi:hypothetical protein